MKLACTYTPLLGGIAVALGTVLCAPSLGAQSIVHHPLQEPVVVHRAAAPAAQASAVTSVPTQQYSHGNPTAEEQYILELINRARANPTQEGLMLKNVTDPAILSAYQYFNVDKNKLATDFATYPVRPPMAFNSKLITAARGHSQDMSDNNFQGHDGTNGSHLEDRLATVSYTGWTAAGENVSAYAQSLLYAHVSFNVDWGVSSLGHRRNTMNFDSDIFTEIGIGIVHDARPSPHTGPIIVTEDFGNAKAPYIVGVVYRDLNSNNFYDVGEGISGITIMPSGGTYYAVSSESGGYAIPVTASGDFTVTASGPGLTSPVTLNVSVGTENVKLDFVAGQASLPGIVSLIAPANASNIAADSTRLVWGKIAGATTYHLQASTDSNFATMIVNDSTLTDSSKILRSLQAGKSYYWHVRAKNDAGWGSFSTRYSFKAQAPAPAQVALISPLDAATVPPTNVTFSWQHGAADVRKYQIEIASGPDMSSPVVSDSTIQDTFKLVTSGLQPGGRYYWHVRAKNGTGWGTYSAIRSLTTATSGVADEVAGAMFHLDANTPNPFSGITHIRFSLASGGDAAVRVVNSVGEEIATLASGRFGAGEHEITWDAAGLPSGVYYCQVRCGDRVESIKMMLTR